MARSKLREYFLVEYHPGKRVFLLKIGFYILTFCCLSYCMNYVNHIHETCARRIAQLDRSNLVNAYVSGIEGRLRLYGRLV
jgi:MFS transporter, ACS family, pantothenate transporter